VFTAGGESQTVSEGSNLTFGVDAAAPSGDDLTYSASGLPAGATFDPATHQFSWTPSHTQAGTYTVTFTASDGTGSDSFSASKVVTITVVYEWGGFQSPIDTGDVVNSVKAGSAVPIKFSLTGDHGLAILAAGSPTVQFGACSDSAAVDAIEQTAAAGASGLQYDPYTDTYTYVWKTSKSWAGTCGTLVVALADGTSHTALFSFLK
jgi:hypothetical protein